MLTVLTYSSMGDSVAHKLTQSCQKYGYPLVFMGKDVWFTNFRQIKIDLLLEWLRTVQTPYAMYTDAPDSWFLSDIFPKYKRLFASKVVVSANRDHYPVTDLYDFETAEWPTGSSFRHICSSQFIGPTKKLIALFECMQQEYLGYVDQEGWQYLYVAKKFPFVIDNRCQLFLNMTGVDPSEITSKWELVETGSKPCAIHFGGAKGDSPNGLAMQLLYERWQSQQ